MIKLNEVLKEIQNGKIKFEPISQSEEDMIDFQSLAKTLIHAHREGFLEECLPHKNTETSHNWFDLILVRGGLSYKGEQYLMKIENEQNMRADEKVNMSNPIKILNDLIDNIKDLPSINRFGSNPEFNKWKKRVQRNLKNIFGENSKQLKEFNRVQFFYTGYRGIDGVAVPQDDFTYKNGLTTTKAFLESCIEEINENGVLRLNQNSVTGVPNTRDQKKVFIVHGHDDTAKVNVARFVEKLGLRAIILHEQPNKGQTIIEKFESNASSVGFAIVLLTPDDIAAPKDTPNETSLRARQNVILELGYFCGILGRDKVCVLYKEGVEIPSDYLGVVYTPLDNSQGWHLKLAKEMKEAGLSVDLNDAL